MLSIKSITQQIINGDGFTVSTLTDSINTMDIVPGRIQELAIFEEGSISTTDLKFEYKNGVVSLIQSTVRGGEGVPLNEGGKRNILTFKTMHIKQVDTLLADSLQNVKPFGGMTEDDCVMVEVNSRLKSMRRNAEATIELQKVGALVGKIIEPDGTVAIDLFKEFNITPEIDVIDLTATGTVRRQVRAVKAKSRNELKVPNVAKWLALCGPKFYDDILENQDIKESYLRYKEGQVMRDDVDSISFGGVTWEEYDAVVGDTRYIAEDEAILIPVFEGLCLTKYAPADYSETVNTLGIPHYAKMEPLPMDRGFNLEVQSNPISVVAIPKAVRRIKLKNA